MSIEGALRDRERAFGQAQPPALLTPMFIKLDRHRWNGEGRKRLAVLSLLLSASLAQVKRLSEIKHPGTHANDGIPRAGYR